MFDLVSVAWAAEQASNPGIAGQLGLDWHLFVAQLVNFGIIFFVVWRFVVKPISRSLQQRQALAEATVKNAKDVEDKLNNAKADYQRAIADAKKEAVGILSEAEKQAAATGAAMKDRAQKDIAASLASAKQVLADERDKMLKDVRVAAADLVISATGKVITEGLDERAEKAFVSKLAKK